MALGDRCGPADGMEQRFALAHSSGTRRGGSRVGFWRCAVALLVVSCTSTQPLPAPVSAPPQGQRPGNAAEETRPPSVVVASTDGCPHDEATDVLRLPFDAFGPAAMSFALLGQAWWQWDSEGHGFDSAQDTVWVVVHNDVDPASLRSRFPVREDAKCDHRYLTLDEARDYLSAHIEELEGAEVPGLTEVRTRLQSTLEVLDEHFDSSAE